jgi:hypothetical protein
MSKNYSKYKERYLLLKNQYGGANVGDHVFIKEGSYIGKITKISDKKITYKSPTGTDNYLNIDDKGILWEVINAKIGDNLYSISSREYLGKIIEWNKFSEQCAIQKGDNRSFIDPKKENVEWFIGPSIDTETEKPSENWGEWFSKKFKDVKGLASNVSNYVYKTYKAYTAAPASTPAASIPAHPAPADAQTSTPAPASEPSLGSTVSPAQVQPQKFIYFVECTWLTVGGVFINVIASTPQECTNLINKDVAQTYHKNVFEQVNKAKRLELKDASQESKIFYLK